MKKYTVELRWWTGTENSDYMLYVTAPNPMAARYAAIIRLRQEQEIKELQNDQTIKCRAIYAGHLKNLWKVEL